MKVISRLLQLKNLFGRNQVGMQAGNSNYPF